jgi:hypothetical protein
LWYDDLEYISASNICTMLQVHGIGFMYCMFDMMNPTATAAAYTYAMLHKVISGNWVVNATLAGGSGVALGHCWEAK